MPLTPEETQADQTASESGTRPAESSDSWWSRVMNSKYLKPVAALLVAAGAGYLVQRLRGRKKPSDDASDT